MTTALALVALFALSAYFSGSEAALTALSDYQLRRLHVQRPGLRRALEMWARRPHRFIVAILVGNTVVNLILTSTVTAAVARILPLPRTVVEVLVWVCLTPVVIVACELAPKIIGRWMPVAFTVFALPPLQWLQGGVSLLLAPFLSPLERFSRTAEVPHFTSMSELRSLIAESSRRVYRSDVSELFTRALLFNEVRVHAIMTPRERVDMVDIAGRSFADIVQAIIDTGRTRVPLYEGNPDQVVGFALVKDLFYLSTGGGECTVADLIHPILEAPDGMLARDLLQRFKSSQIHIARVNDAAGRFIGIVTLEDIVEELMGEILDEYDTKRVHS